MMIFLMSIQNIGGMPVRWSEARKFLTSTRYAAFDVFPLAGREFCFEFECQSQQRYDMEHKNRQIGSSLMKIFRIVKPTSTLLELKSHRSEPSTYIMFAKLHNFFFLNSQLINILRRSFADWVMKSLPDVIKKSVRKKLKENKNSRRVFISPFLPSSSSTLSGGN